MKYLEKAIAHLASENERLKEELEKSKESDNRVYGWWQEAKRELEALKSKV